MTLFERNGKKEKNSALLDLRRIAIGVILGIAIFFIFSALFSFIMTLDSVPDGILPIFAFVSLGIGSFFAGFFSLLKIGSGGLVNGLICGGMIAVLHLLLSLIFFETGNTVFIVISLATEIISATVGGIVAVNLKN